MTNCGSSVDSAAHVPAESRTHQQAAGAWTFLSNHGHVLLCIAAEPDQTLEAIAGQVQITSRAVQLILADLITGGYVERVEAGRRNHYSINPDGQLRHPLESHRRRPVGSPRSPAAAPKGQSAQRRYLTYELQFVIVGAEGSTSTSRLVVGADPAIRIRRDTHRLVGRVKEDLIRARPGRR